MEALTTDEGGEIEIGEVRGRGKGDLDYYIISTMSEDEMRGNEDENTQEEEEGPSDHCMRNVRLIYVNPLEAGLKAHELVITMREVS
ncbi:hypothetical protein B296_00014123 [Ensete ventricosum]|uniref:Uncharacterized protein n=1 Tax=Ensete ventricosum TaxID=4639 RepID=A0A426Z5R4_ENSVE|nr:hypothetical protein B296_00014123 [Ensete ventricosum]